MGYVDHDFSSLHMKPQLRLEATADDCFILVHPHAQFLFMYPDFLPGRVNVSAETAYSKQSMSCTSSVCTISASISRTLFLSSRILSSISSICLVKSSVSIPSWRLRVDRCVVSPSAVGCIGSLFLKTGSNSSWEMRLSVSSQR